MSHTSIPSLEQPNPFITAKKRAGDPFDKGSTRKKLSTTMSDDPMPPIPWPFPTKTAKKRASDAVEEGSPPKKLRVPVAEAFAFDAEPIVVIVGEEKKKFFVHECIVSASSDFFKNALKSDWKEGASRTVELPTKDPEIFKIYLNWLYFGLFCITTDGNRTSASGYMSQDKEWGRWSACYLLGSFLLDTAFGDALIDMAGEKMSLEYVSFVNLSEVVYSASPRGSRHRKLAVDLAIKVWVDCHFIYTASCNYCQEFSADLIIAMGGKLRAGGAKCQSARDFFEDIDTCKYHDHTLDNTPCYIERRKHSP